MELIFELSEKGRKGYRLPKLEVPAVDVAQYLGEYYREDLNFPEVSELDVIRHYTKLSQRNYAIDTTMVPLGSCTMKYNPKINEELAMIETFTQMHPFAPEDCVQGTLRLMYELKELLKELSGFAEVCLQPAAGAQGELLGLLLITAYHRDRGNIHKNKILVPDSAHGTNPASASICGLEVVSVKSDSNGELDWEDFIKKLDDRTAGLMLTNPNTLGIFERKVKKLADALHQKDALLYMDGANFNALVGVAKPATWGVDVMHFNLHKTFSTPHGGGGPGAGPVGVSEKLKPYLPVPQVEFDGQRYYLNWDIPKSVGKVLTFYGHVGVMLRALAYILSYGKEIDKVSKFAVLNARYLHSLLKDVLWDPYPNSPKMHEVVFSMQKTGISPLNLAKALLDKGFYAPTIYFPLVVKDAVMIEPTETESPKTLRAFANAIKEILQQDPEEVKTSPKTTPARRIKEAEANRKPILRASLA